MAARFDCLLINAHLATMTASGTAYGAVLDAALAIEGGRIVWLGPMAELPEHEARQVIDVKNGWITPGLIDAHTHLVFAGDRADEFEQRLLGTTYEELARRGGGIAGTVRATRGATAGELQAAARRRLARLLAEGVTTVEIKSGYGLDLETEIRMLEVARELGRDGRLDVVTSFLGAHALPSEFASDRRAYLDLVCEEVLPEIAKRRLADAVDAFCENIAFSPDETARVFAAAKRHGLPVKLHADQLSDTGGAALAARHHALSADHLEYTSEAGVRAIAKAGTVAMLLPGAFYTLKQSRIPPIEAFRRHGVPMAVATDCNPGSSPICSLLLALNMAATLFGLSPEEALRGVTSNAARALGLAQDRGTLVVGGRADLVSWRIQTPAELVYWLGLCPIEVVLKDGRCSYPTATR